MDHHSFHMEVGKYFRSLYISTNSQSSQNFLGEGGDEDRGKIEDDERENNVGISLIEIKTVSETRILKPLRHICKYGQIWSDRTKSRVINRSMLR